MIIRLIRCNHEGLNTSFPAELNQWVNMKECGKI